jgi:hypothetical protein
MQLKTLLNIKKKMRRKMMSKFYIEARETHVYKTMVEAQDRNEASEKFWELYSDLEPSDIRDADITFIAESQQ